MYIYIYIYIYIYTYIYIYVARGSHLPLPHPFVPGLHPKSECDLGHAHIIYTCACIYYMIDLTNWVWNNHHGDTVGV